MAYNEAWDETQPADTSLANLLGQVIRNFKTDIRQRVSSFASGTLANRPTPESVWTGVMYFATDTAQIFQWSGSAWVDITQPFSTTRMVWTNSGNITTNGTAQTLSSLTWNIPTGLNSMVKMKACVEIFSSSSPGEVDITIGGTNIFAGTIGMHFSGSLSVATMMLDVTFVMQGATNNWNAQGWASANASVYGTPTQIISIGYGGNKDFNTSLVFTLLSPASNPTGINFINQMFLLERAVY